MAFEGMDRIHVGSAYSVLRSICADILCEKMYGRARSAFGARGATKESAMRMRTCSPYAYSGDRDGWRIVPREEDRGASDGGPKNSSAI